MSDEILRKDKSLSTNEQKRKQEKEKKQKRKELLTVLAILSSVFMQAIIIVFLKGGERMVREFTGGSVQEARKIYENTRNVLIGLGVISLIIMIVFVIQVIKERKKRKRTKNEKKAFIDYDRLEMARIRVEKARMEAKKQGKTSTAKSDDRYRRLKDINEDEYIRKSRPKGMSEEEYRKMRKEEYDRYMSMDFSEDMDDEDNSFLEGYFAEEDIDDYEEYTRWDRIKEFFVEHGFVIGVIAGIAVLVIMATIIVGILL